jgi:hypothetical protein
MVERQPSRPPIPEPQHTPHEGGNGAPGIPPSINELAKPPPDAAVNKPSDTPDQRREKHRKYMKDYRKRNKDKVNAYQRRYTNHEIQNKRPNEKLRLYQAQRAEERIAKFREQQANESSTDLAQGEPQQSEVIQIYPARKKL